MPYKEHLTLFEVRCFKLKNLFSNKKQHRVSIKGNIKNHVPQFIF